MEDRHISISELPPGAHIHMLGICGTAMASLAGLLKDRGFRVTGSDSNPYPPMSTQIQNLGIQLYSGYSRNHLRERPDFVVIGNVISASNEEAQEVLRLGVPSTSLPKAMGEMIIEDRASIVVAGTHGKTTTTSMMAWVADQVGAKPGFLIGGIPKNFSRSFQNPRGRIFVIEGDEYDTAYFDKVPKFVHYRPRHVIFTSCEFDHADIYRDFDHVKSAFRMLMDLIPPGGSLHYWADDPNVSALAAVSKAGLKRGYGLGEDAELRATELVAGPEGQSFRALVVERRDGGVVVGRRDGAAVVERHDGGAGAERCAGSAGAGAREDAALDRRDLGVFRMELTGEYNVLNALAVIGVALKIGWDLEKVRAALASFQGVKRRQEILGEPGGVLVIEDFAHHPTAVRETLKGLRARYPNRRLWAVFEPRSATSRRKVFQKDYAESFGIADEVCLARAFDQSKIDEGERFSSDELVADLKAKGQSAVGFDNADAIVTELATRAKAGDVVVIMSNGGFDGIYTKLMKTLGDR